MWMCSCLLLRAAAGVSHLLERLAFKATHNRSAFRVTREVRFPPSAPHSPRRNNPSSATALAPPPASRPPRDRRPR